MNEHLTDAQRAEIRAIVREEIEAGRPPIVTQTVQLPSAEEMNRIIEREAERRKALRDRRSHVADWPAKKADDQAVREAIASRNAVGIAAIAVAAWVFGIVLAVAILVGAR